MDMIIRKQLNDIVKKFDTEAYDFTYLGHCCKPKNFKEWSFNSMTNKEMKESLRVSAIYTPFTEEIVKDINEVNCG